MSRNARARQNPISIDQLRQWDREIVWHAFSQMAEYEGLIIESAKGCWLSSIDGKRYLDGAGSLWCNVHGHAHPTIDAAIVKQLSQVAHVTSLGMSHPTTIGLAKRLVDLAPEGLHHVFFSSDGASAVEVAMKMAFQYWRQCPSPQPNRCTFLAVGDGYHGDTLGAVSVSGVSRFQAVFQPLLFPVLRGPCPDSYRCIALDRDQHLSTERGMAADRIEKRLDDRACSAFYLEAYEAILREHAAEIAAVIVEPLIQGAAGMIMHPVGFLAGLSALTKKYGTLFIADEVAVGMGRTGRMFACEHEAVQPDLLCLGKGLTGGYLPLSATLCSHGIWEAFLGDAESRTFFHGHTYGGNPLAAAAAHGTLDVFEDEETLLQLPIKASRLASRLAPLRQHPHVGDVRQRGLVAAVELVQNKEEQKAFPREERRGARVCREALKRGVWLRPLGNVIPLVPPLAISDSELDLLVDALVAGIDIATRS